MITEIKDKNKERAEHGKDPIYLKKGDVKKETLKQKFDELEKRGQLDNYNKKKEVE